MPPSFSSGSIMNRPGAGRPGHANLPIGLEKAVRLSETGNTLMGDPIPTLSPEFSQPVAPQRNLLKLF